MENLYSAEVERLTNGSASISADEFSKESVLSLVAVLGSSISLVGLVFAFITYSLFSDLRNFSGTSLMNLLAALFMNQLLYVIGVGGVQDSELCMGLVFSLLYIKTAVWAWLLVMAFSTYRGFQDNLILLPAVDNSIQVRFWTSSLFGWGSPLLPLSLAIPLQTRNINITDLEASNCLTTTGTALILAAVLPTTLLLALVLAVLSNMFFVIRKTVSLQVTKKAREKMARHRTVQLSLLLKLTTVLSASWFCSLVYHTTHLPLLWVCLTLLQASQGFIIAMSVTCNCHVLGIYTRSLQRRPKPHLYGGLDSELSVSMSLQLLHPEPAPDIV